MAFDSALQAEEISGESEDDEDDESEKEEEKELEPELEKELLRNRNDFVEADSDMETDEVCTKFLNNILAFHFYNLFA